MIRNVPYSFTFQDLANIINYEFSYCYDFLYLPLRTKVAHMGYAFINFIAPPYLYAFYHRFHGSPWPIEGRQPHCFLSYSRLQGYDALLEDLNVRGARKGHAICNSDLSYAIQLYNHQQAQYG
jgi:hypothetical protein